MYSLYKHTCPNGKVYIGITSKEPELRWLNGRGYKDNPKFFNAILKYGWDNIQHEILASNLTREDALHSEYAQIIFHKSNLPQYGYNRTCTELSIKQPKRMKDVSTDSPFNKTVSQYTLDGQLVNQYESQTIASIKTGIQISGISKCCNGESISAGGYVWRYGSDDFKLKPDKRIKRVVAKYSKDGYLLHIYRSLKEASDQTGINHGSICSCCKGRKGIYDTKVHTAGGYKWSYLRTIKKVSV